jgi:hypothetical protein
MERGRTEDSGGIIFSGMELPDGATAIPGDHPYLTSKPRIRYQGRWAGSIALGAPSLQTGPGQTSEGAVFRSPAHCVAGPSGPVLEHPRASPWLTRTRLRLRSTFAECLSNPSHELLGLSRDIVQGAAAQSNGAVACSAATLRRGNRYAGIAFGSRGADHRYTHDAHYPDVAGALLHGTKAMLARQIGQT